MNTRNFRCFQIVYEEKNLQAAASKLFMSPQGVSRIIRSLEDEIGSPLFVRAKGGLIPTPSGKLFYEKSKILTKDLNEMFSAIGALNDKDRQFKLGFSAGTIRAIDIPLVNKFIKNNPEIIASWSEVSNETVIQQLQNDDIGLGLVIGEPVGSGLKYHKVKSISTVLYVYKGHRLWVEQKVCIKDIQNEPIITMDESFRIYHTFLTACHLNDFHPEIVGTVKEGDSIIRLVDNKVGIGIAPKFFEDTDNVRAITIKDAPSWDIYCAYREDSVDVKLAEKLLQATKNS